MAEIATGIKVGDSFSADTQMGPLVSDEQLRRAFPEDISKAHAMAKRLRAGTVWINCYNIFDAALPFGRYEQSGWGREMGRRRWRPTPR